MDRSIVTGIKNGVGFLIVAGCVGMISRFSSFLMKKITERIYFTIDIDSKDKTYEWVLYWLSKNEAMEGARHLSTETIYNTVGKNPKVIYVPSIGNHKIVYKGKTMWIERIRDSKFDLGSGAPFESITIKTFPRNQSDVQELIQEAMKLSLTRDIGKTVFYMNDGGQWQRFGNPRTIRSLDSVILADDLKKHVLLDIKEFLNNEAWYRNRGIPYRRGYLLHGPPGNGKSSFITALAGELNLDICIVSLAQKDMNDKLINHLLNTAPPKSILLIEDIDASFNLNRSQVSTDQLESNSSVTDRLTLSGLLNAMDGVASQEGRLLFMTTNKVDLLDNALTREGRVDVKIPIQNAIKSQAKQLFNHFYCLDQNSQLSERFSSSIQDHQLSMSQVQGFLLNYMHSPEQAIENVYKLTPVKIN